MTLKEKWNTGGCTNVTSDDINDFNVVGMIMGVLGHLDWVYRINGGLEGIHITIPLFEKHAN